MITMQKPQDFVARLNQTRVLFKDLLPAMNDNSRELPEFFERAEKLFAQHDVKEDLKIPLLTPLLSERARKRLAAMNIDASVNYNAWKETLMKEFAMSALQYRNEFHKAIKQSDENYKQLRARLLSLLNSYVSARKAATRDELIDIMVADKIYDLLPYQLRLHVADRQRLDKQIFSSEKLCETIDFYIIDRAYVPTSSRHSDSSDKGWGTNNNGNSTLSHSSQTSPSRRSSVDKDIECNYCKKAGHLIRDCHKLQNKKLYESSRHDSSKVSKSASRAGECFNCGKVGHIARNCEGKTASYKQVKAVSISKPDDSTNLIQNDVQNNGLCLNAANNNTQTDCTHSVETVINSSSSTFPPPQGQGYCFCCHKNYEIKTVHFDTQGLNTCSKLSRVNTKDQQLLIEATNKIGFLVDSGASVTVAPVSVLPENFNLEDKSIKVVLQGAFGEEVQGFLTTLNVSLCDTSCCYAPAKLHIAVTKTVQGNEVLITPEDYELLKSAGCDEQFNDQYITGTRLLFQQSNDAEADVRTCMESAIVYAVKSDDLNKVELINPYPSVDFSSVFDWTDKLAAEKFKVEQEQDQSLQSVWAEARNKTKDYFVNDQTGLLYHRKQFGSNILTRLVLPESRRKSVFLIAHDSPWGSHFGRFKTQRRLELYFTWPMLANDVKQYVKTCTSCQLHMRKTKLDRIPIQPVSTPLCFGDLFYADLIGPLSPESSAGHKYVLSLVDAATAWPEMAPLKTLGAKELCDQLVIIWCHTGLPRAMSTDCGTNFTAQLSEEVYKRFGIEIRHSTPLHPEGNSKVERFNQTLKSMLHHFMMNSHKPREWHKVLPVLALAFREVPSASRGLSPAELVYGRPIRGPLAVLKDSWQGTKLPEELLLATTEEYLSDLRLKLHEVRQIASEKMEDSQSKSMEYYNQAAKSKEFKVGDLVVVLLPTSSNKLLSRWTGPGTVTGVKSPNSYFVALDTGSVRIFHANDMRKFYIRVNVVGVIFDDETEFGEIPIYEAIVESFDDQFKMLDLSHLQEEQQEQLYQILKKHATVFIDKPGSCNVNPIEIKLEENFVPKPQKIYRIPEKLKAEVDRQIQDLLQARKIRPSQSQLCHPILMVAKADKKSYRMVTDLRYLNSHVVNDQFPLPLTDELLLRIGNSSYITKIDAKNSYFQLPIREQDKYLTAFRTHNGLYEWEVLPQGLKTAPSAFSRVMKNLLQPHSEYADAYLDDAAVFSVGYQMHLQHIDNVLQSMENINMTLNMSKCEFAKPHIVYLGHRVGSGLREVVQSKVLAIQSIPEPVTKKQLRGFLGAATFYRSYVPKFSELVLSLTDLTKKNLPNSIKFNDEQRRSFKAIKDALCAAVALHQPDYSKEFYLRTDASDRSIGAMLSQKSEDGTEFPIAFVSSKLSATQERWSTIEKESYSIVFALKKLDHIIFSTRIILLTDHEPLIYIGTAVNSSSKLLRWALYISRYDIEVRHISGKDNVFADFLSRVPG